MDAQDQEQLRRLSTAELLRHVVEESRLLVKAELLHAKQELREEIHAAKAAGMMLGSALVLGVCGLAAVVVALGIALPVGTALGVVLVGAVLLVLAALAGVLGYRKVPRQPLPHTQERLKTDLELTREQLA